jgi:DNA-binding NarL/FixJ family response regulator
MYGEPAYARLALKAGACGYVVKHSAWSELIPAILSALEGNIFVSASLSGVVGRESPHE